MAYELFKETGTRTKEFISITEKKAFGMSRAFLDHYSITADHKVVIFFDPDELKVALYFSLKDPKFGFSVRIPNEKHGASVVAKSFFDVKGIDAVKYSGRYSNFVVTPIARISQGNAEGNAYVLTLKEAEPAPEADEPVGVDAIADIEDQPIDLSEIPW